MYPLSVVLVGLGPEVAAAVRAELLARHAGPEFEADSPDAVHERYAGSDGPRRLLVLRVRSAADAVFVRKLREAFPGWPVLALTQAADDPGIFFAVNRAGAEQVVPLPLDAADFGTALDRLAAAVRPGGRSDLLVAVSAVVPGCGGSAVAAGLAAELAHGYGSTLLVAYGVDASPLPADPDVAAVKRAMVPVAPRLNRLAVAPDAAAVGAGPAGFLHVLELGRHVAAGVVADVPCAYDDLHFDTLWAADQVVLVADQTVPAVRTARMILDAVAQSGPGKRVHVVLNRYNPTVRGLTAGSVSEALGGFAVIPVPGSPGGMAVGGLKGLTRAVAVGAGPERAAARTLFARLVGVFKSTGG